MSLYDIFGISGSGLSAQSVRLNTVASNLANADDVSGSAKGAYRARQPVFAAVLENAQNPNAIGVKVSQVQQSQSPIRKEYEPNNPLANKQGYVYTSNVNTVSQLANMMDASRTYQSDINVITTTQQLLMNTLKL